MEENYFQPIDLSPELQRAARLKDMLTMRNMDISHREEVTDVLKEINVRFIQYVKAFPMYSMDFLILQSVNDFKMFLRVLQTGAELDKNKQLATLPDGRPVFVNTAIKRSDYQDGLPMIFITEAF